MPANFVLLERIELNASAASISFTNIPQSGYTDLKVVVSARCTTGTIRNLYMNLNSDTGNNYSFRILLGNGSSASSTNSTAEGFNNVAWVGYIPGSGVTSSTFGNAEIYIPNYAGSAYKSISSDSVYENNGTTAYQSLNANLWNSTSAITSITLKANSDNLDAYSTFSLYGLAAVGTTPAIAPKASGGNITTDGTYWIHTFNSTGTFVPQTSLSCDYLVIAGGGGGSTYAGGGGGAGGYKYATSQSLSATSYTVTVGAGGAGYSGTSSGLGSNGGNSSFNSDVMTGGGRGGGPGGNPGGSNGASGGSGGGAAGISTAVGGAGTSGQGYAGGDSPGSSGGGGGGGGSSAAGSNGTNTYQGGNGGAGTANSITGSSVTRAGGGGGGPNATGSAGGGNGTDTGIPAGSATANSGSGGGGCWLNAPAGNGGSGIVIIRYAI